MNGMWKPPGQKASPASWSYDLSGGWGVGAGQDEGFQYEMPPGASPGPDAPGAGLTVHPPGVAAPVDQINYTPGLDQFHPPGVQAPIDQENLTLTSPDPMAGAMPQPGDVDPGYAATALRRAAIGQTISPLRQTQEILSLLGFAGDEPQVPMTGNGQAVGSGQDVGAGATMPGLKEMADALLRAGFPAYAVYQALQGSGGGAATPVQSPGATSPFAGATASGSSPGWPQAAGAAASPTRTPAPAGGNAEDFLGGASGGPPIVQPVTGGYVTIDPTSGKVDFYDTTGEKQSKSPYVAVGGQLFNTQTGEFTPVPTDKKDQAPTALGGGAYWNPQTGQVEYVKEPTKPNTQAIQNGDGTYTIIDMNTGQEIAQGGHQKQQPATILPGERGGYTAIDPETGQPIFTQQPGDKGEPVNPMQTPTGDIVVWDPATGSYRKAYEENRFTTADGSVVEIQPDGSISYIYKRPKQFTLPDGSIVEQDPETGQYTMPFAMPEKQAPGWQVRGIQQMFPDAFTPESLVGSDYTSSHPGGDPWRPDVPGPVRGAGANGSPPGFSQQGLTDYLPWAQMGQEPDSNTMIYDAGRGPNSFQDFTQQAMAWNPFAGKGGVGMGQDSIVPPVAPADVVGTGHRFGEPVSMEGSHMGVDLQAYKGTDTVSPVDGVVTQIKDEPDGLGLQVVIQDRVGTQHTLGHLDSVGVQEGDLVHAGDDVAKVGESGAGATGPHLDYRQKDANGAPLDPTAALGPLAQMPRADDGSEPMPPGMGQDWNPYDPDTAFGVSPQGVDWWDPDAQGGGLPFGLPRPMPPHLVTEPPNRNRRMLPVGRGQDSTQDFSAFPMPDTSAPQDNPWWQPYADGTALLNPETSPFGAGQDVGVGEPINFTSEQLRDQFPWAQLFTQNQQAENNSQRNYQIAMIQAYQNWVNHQDDNQYRADVQRAQQAFQNKQLALQAQQQTLGPYMQAAFNNPWLTRLSGQTPAWGQVGGPGGPWSPRLGASEGMQRMLQQAGADPYPDAWPGYGGRGRSAKLGLAVSVPSGGQVQYDFDPLRYLQVRDNKYSQADIDRGRKGVPDITPPPNAPETASGQPAFKWIPANPANDTTNQYDYWKDQNNPKRNNKFTLGVLGGVRRRDVLHGRVPFSVYGQLSPFQRAGLRSDLNMNEQNFGDWQMNLRENWGKTGGPTEMPGMTMMHAMAQDPTQREGTSQLADTFGQTPDQYYQQQQKKWATAFAPSVKQSA